jgi:hypothetical protein
MKNIFFLFVISIILLSSCTKEQPYVAPVEDGVAAYLIGGKEIKVNGNNLYTNGYRFRFEDPQVVIDTTAGQYSVVIADSTGEILEVYPYETIAPAMRPRAMSYDIPKESVYSWLGNEFSLNGVKFLWPKNLHDEDIKHHHSLLFINTRYGAVVIKLDDHYVWDWYSLVAGILFLLLAKYWSKGTGINEGGDGCLTIFFAFGGVVSLIRFVIAIFI